MSQKNDRCDHCDNTTDDLSNCDFCDSQYCQKCEDQIYECEGCHKLCCDNHGEFLDNGEWRCPDCLAKLIKCDVCQEIKTDTVVVQRRRAWGGAGTTFWPEHLNWCLQCRKQNTGVYRRVFKNK